MGDLLELGEDCRVDLPFPVAVDRHPQRRHPVEVVFPVDVGQDTAFAALDDDLGFLLPVPHLGEGVPEVPLVQFLHLRRAAELLFCRARSPCHERLPAFFSCLAQSGIIWYRSTLSMRKSA